MAKQVSFTKTYTGINPGGYYYGEWINCRGYKKLSFQATRAGLGTPTYFIAYTSVLQSQINAGANIPLNLTSGVYPKPTYTGVSDGSTIGICADWVCLMYLAPISNDSVTITITLED